MSTTVFSNLHGLIVGIDSYKYLELHSPLRGCVRDATSIFNYFTNDLKVSPSQLQCLFNAEATREGILNAFQKHLITNEGVHYSDPIVIYFAGYGDRQAPPTGWHVNADEGPVNMVLPYDAGRGYEDREYVHGIPGQTLGGLMHVLREIKGNNITLVLDCCFSGSNTKGHAQTRYSHDPNAPLIPSTLDNNIKEILSPSLSAQARYIATPKRAACILSTPSDILDLGAHITLAACRSNEQAQEIFESNLDTGADPPSPVSGLFTTALLKALRGCNPITTSYASLMQGVQQQVADLVSQATEKGEVKLELQSPRCNGRKQSRLLFHTQSGLCKGMIPLEPGQEENTFRIKAGNASGIQLGTELDLYSKHVLNETLPLARLVVVQVTAVDATLCLQGTESTLDLPRDAYVVVAKRANQTIRILKNESELPQHWDYVFSEVESLPIAITWSKHGEHSDLVLIPSEGGVLLHRQDPYVIQLNPRDILLKHELSAEDLAQKLRAITHFHFHLQRQNPNSLLEDRYGTKLVGMKLIELKDAGCSYSWAPKEYAPVEEYPKDLFGDSLSTGRVIQLQAVPEKRYGLQLTNNSDWPLFAWVIYFDLEDYSINFLYEPYGRDSSPPLRKNKPLTIGYGGNGTDPLRVANSGYSRTECGVFMLFVSSDWVDISHIEQVSIFAPVEEAKPHGREQGRGVEPGSSVWDVLVAGVSISEY
ncbi:hypothetical protein FRC09_006502 [Ceratobasidium sp. 395]|nr:hypothetical protein FRC09_006502 [Ceratobasidium sp. 395]